MTAINSSDYSVAAHKKPNLNSQEGACIAFQAPVQLQPNSLYAPDSSSLTDEQRRTSVFS